MPEVLDLGIVQGTLLELWEGILSYLPELIGAIIVFLLGLIVASVLRRVVVKVVEVLKLDELARKFELRQSLERYGMRLHIGNLLGWIVKWFVIIVALIAATDVLGWDQVTEFLQNVVMYVPNVIIAVVILLAGILLANFVQRVVKSAVEAGKLASADFLSGVARWAILVFTFMAALVQLQIAGDLIEVLFTGLIAMLALAGGLAFGLGGRDHASRFLDRLRRDISSQ